MEIRPLSIEGAFVVTPAQHADTRGQFLEWFRHDHLQAALGHPMRIAQANLAVSGAGVVRGVHFADVPPGQAKYVTCPSGAVWDAVVDLRVGSPTFGRWEGVRLDDVERRALYLAEGLGHGFCSLTEGSVVTYACSATYAPSREHAVHPLDPDLAIAWPVPAPLLSEKDRQAPSLARALAEGVLPDHAACASHSARLAGLVGLVG